MRDENLQRFIEMLVIAYGIDAIEDAIKTMGLSPGQANEWLEFQRKLDAQERAS